jgi:cyclopropane fatty-acyl-phospholipid synthase-like methyltransferase
MMKPFSEACAENQYPILAILRETFSAVGSVLEIGSGTGQHAVHFARHLAHLTWQTSDLSANHPGIHAWLDEAALPNIRLPITLDVNANPWPVEPVEGVFSANTLHIVSWPEVAQLFRGVGQVLLPGGVMCVYGPFNYGGEFTSPSNARFDEWLKARDPASGVRDFETVCALALQHGLSLSADHAMPVNNRILAFRKD